MELELLPNEEIIYKEKVSSFYVNLLYSLGGIFVVLMLLHYHQGPFLLLMGVCFIVYAYCLKKFTSFVLTNKRIVYKTGIIGQRVIEIKIEKVESVQIYQGALGRIFNYGDLIFSGAGNPTVSMLFVDHPVAFKQKYLELESKNNKK